MNELLERPTVTPEDGLRVDSVIQNMRADGEDPRRWFNRQLDDFYCLAKTAAERDLTEDEMIRWTAAAKTVEAFYRFCNDSSDNRIAALQYVNGLWGEIEIFASRMRDRQAAAEIRAKEEAEAVKRKTQALRETRPSSARDAEAALRALGYSKAIAKAIVAEKGIPGSDSRPSHE